MLFTAFQLKIVTLKAFCTPYFLIVSSCVLMIFAVPISVYILSLPLPYLPEGTSLSPFFLLGCAILLCGLFLYNTTRPVRSSSEDDWNSSSSWKPMLRRNYQLGTLPKKNVSLEALLIHYHCDYSFERKICSVFTFKGRFAALWWLTSSFCHWIIVH